MAKERSVIFDTVERVNKVRAVDNMIYQAFE